MLCIAADGASAQCAEEGHGLSPATDEFSPKQLQRDTKRAFGATLARIIRAVPWDVVWRGDWFSETPYFIQGFDKPLELPRVRLRVAAPPPLTITIDLEITTNTLPCIPIQLSSDTTFDHGSVMLRAPTTVVITMAVGSISERVTLSSEQTILAWDREDGRTSMWLETAELRFGLVAPRSTGAVAQTMETLRDSKELRAKGVLVRSLGKPGIHRAKAVLLLSDFGFEHVGGESWVLLRRLQNAGKLSSAEVKRLGWLARRPTLAADDDAAIFVSSEPTPPRLFVAGKELSTWKRVGDTHELRVPVRGFVPVRAEFHTGSSQAFMTVLDRDVRIRLMDIWGPTVEARRTGPRCGLVVDYTVATCGDIEGDRVPVGTTFSLSECGGPAAYGSGLYFGVFLVPSLPGLYIRDRRGLHFDPTYGGKAACDQ